MTAMLQSWLRWAGYPYELAARLRLWGYTRGWFETHRLPRPVISIGNLTVGGTGKTPVVMHVVDRLTAQGKRVAILSRGYRRRSKAPQLLVSDGRQVLAGPEEAGDEPYLMARRCPHAIVAVGADRYALGQWVLSRLPLDCFVLDDGFQHLKVKRDLDIVLIDATNPFGNNQMLPTGILRESLSGLKRADAIVVTRANLVKDVSKIKAEILRINPNCQIFVSQNKFINAVKLKELLSKESTDQKSKIKNLKLMAFCALGNPDNFYEQLRQEKFNLVATKSFPDHHIYSNSEMRNLEKEAIEKGTEVLLTTAKDAVKLTHLRFNLPCYVIENGLTFEDESAFVNLIQNPKN